MFISAFLFMIAAFCYGRAGGDRDRSDLSSVGFPLIGLIFTVLGAIVGYQEVKNMFEVLAN